MYVTQKPSYTNDSNHLNKRDLEVLDTIHERVQDLAIGKFTKANQIIDTEGASERIAAIAERVDKIVQDLSELNEFASELANGHLDVVPPGRQNFIAANLKALHSQLIHLTWQAQRVQEGDYNQSVDFMGEFSVAFNSMVKALSERTERMEYEIAANRKARMAIAKSQQILEFVLENVTEIIIVIAQTNVLFSNDMAKKELGLNNTKDRDSLFHAILAHTSPSAEIYDYDYYDRNRDSWFHIRSIPISWLDQNIAFLQVVTDITERKANEEKLNLIANTDELTGVSSRRSGLAYLDTCLLNKNLFPISLCYIDIDSLKYVNDRYGHAQGDVYIKAVASAIKEATRKGDNISRLGGDEFMIIFLNKRLPECEVVLNRIINKLNKIALKIEAEYPMSFSYGIEEINTSSPKSAEEYIQIADQKMYAHKRNSRKELLF